MVNVEIYDKGEGKLDPRAFSQTDIGVNNLLDFV